MYSAAYLSIASVLLMLWLTFWWTIPHIYCMKWEYSTVQYRKVQAYDYWGTCKLCPYLHCHSTVQYFIGTVVKQDTFCFTLKGQREADVATYWKPRQSVRSPQTTWRSHYKNILYYQMTFHVHWVIQVFISFALQCTVCFVWYDFKNVHIRLSHTVQYYDVQ